MRRYLFGFTAALLLAAVLSAPGAQAATGPAIHRGVTRTDWPENTKACASYGDGYCMGGTEGDGLAVAAFGSGSQYTRNLDWTDNYGPGEGTSSYVECNSNGDWPFTYTFLDCTWPSGGGLRGTGPVGYLSTADGSGYYIHAGQGVYFDHYYFSTDSARSEMVIAPPADGSQFAYTLWNVYQSDVDSIDIGPYTNGSGNDLKAGTSDNWCTTTCN